MNNKLVFAISKVKQTGILKLKREPTSKPSKV